MKVHFWTIARILELYQMDFKLNQRLQCIYIYHVFVIFIKKLWFCWIFRWSQVCFTPAIFVAYIFAVVYGEKFFTVRHMEQRRSKTEEELEICDKQEVIPPQQRKIIHRKYPSTTKGNNPRALISIKL